MTTDEIIMTRPKEQDYFIRATYVRQLENYCDELENEIIEQLVAERDDLRAKLAELEAQSLLPMVLSTSKVIYAATQNTKIAGMLCHFISGVHHDPGEMVDQRHQDRCGQHRHLLAAD